MMSHDWPIYTVEHLIEKGVLERPLDGNHGAIHPKTNDFVASGIPFIMASDLAGGHIDMKNCKFISEEQASSLQKGFSLTGDILLSHKATIGRTAIVSELNTPYIMLTPQVTYYRILDNLKLNNRYLKYYFDSRPFQDLFDSWANSGSTRAYLGITAQRKLPIAVPPIDIQQAIARILGALDDKIELNREMNRTLGVMAQAIFRSWFIEFDPVIAKADGRQPFFMDAEIAALFPDRFMESVLGPIPEGWDVGCIFDFGEVICGKTPSTRDPDNFGDDVPFITIPDMHGKVFVTHTARSLSQKGANSQHKKFLPKYSVCVSCIATPGLVVLTSNRSQTNQQINSIISRKDVSSYFVYWTLRNLGDEIRAGGSGGTVFHNLNKTNFSQIRILLANKATRNVFHELCEPIMEMIFDRQKESHTLASLRDTLLPKLLSGEIRVGQAEKAVEEVL